MQQLISYTELKTGERETLSFFMLNAFLNSRIDTDHETDDDEEVNIYMAQLLHSIVDGRFYVDNTRLLASSPLEVYHKVEESDNDRHKMRVYRTNADHRFISFGVFGGLGEHLSLYRRTFTSPASYLEEAQRYYGWAAQFSRRMPQSYQGLYLALEKIAAHFEIYLDIVNHMSVHYFDLLRRLGPGELFHLEREAHEAALPQLSRQALDQLLEAYSEWRADPTAENHRRFQQQCRTYQQLNPEFDADKLN